MKPLIDTPTGFSGATRQLIRKKRSVPSRCRWPSLQARDLLRGFIGWYSHKLIERLCERLWVGVLDVEDRGTALIIGSRGDGKRWITLQNVPRTAGEPSTS